MRLTDIRHKLVRDLEGEPVGRVFELHCDQGRVTALVVGPGSLLERFTAKSAGRRIPWEMVKRIEKDAIIVSRGKPERVPRKNAPRTRQGTRRPSGRPSKR